SFFSHRQVHASVKLPALPSVGAQDSSPVVREPTGDEMRFSKEWQGKRYKKMRAFGAFFGGGFYVLGKFTGFNGMSGKFRLKFGEATALVFYTQPVGSMLATGRNCQRVDFTGRRIPCRWQAPRVELAGFPGPAPRGCDGTIQGRHLRDR